MIKYKELTTEELILKLIWRLNLVTEKGYTKPQRNEIEKTIEELKRRGVISQDNTSIKDAMYW